VYEGVVDKPDEHAGLARHAGMDGVLAEDTAQDAVARIGGHASYDVARVDVLEVHLDTDSFEVPLDLFSQEKPDVPELQVPEASLTAGRRREG